MRTAVCSGAAALALLASWMVSAQQATGVRALVDSRLFDGTGAPAVEPATILIRDGRVVVAGRAETVTVPAGAERLSLRGKTVIPGLINAHGHVNDPVRDLATYAYYGVTTVVSLGNEPTPGHVAARNGQDSPALRRARMFTSWPVLDPRDPAEARQAVAGAAALKADIIKIRLEPVPGPKMPPPVYRAVIDEAHRLGLRVAVHIVTLEDAKGVLAAGADVIAHSVRDVPVDAGFIDAMRSRDGCLVPTLMRDVSTYVYESTPPFFSDPLFLKHADAAQVARLREPARQQAMRRDATAQSGKPMYEMGRRNAKRLIDAGVLVAMGTDTGPAGRFQGYFELLELEEMVKAGITPQQALLAATRDAARCMKLDGQLGTVAAGKWADFVVLDADPLADIANVRKINSVWIAGNRIEP